MDKKQIRKEIAVLINSIKEHSDNIGDKEHIPQLELELILHKIEKLYQKSIVFNHLNSSQSYSLPSKEADQQTAVSIPVPESSKAEVVQEKKEEPKTDTGVSATDLFGSELPPVEKPKVEKPKVEKKTEKKPEKPNDARILKPSISDIKTAIGINDKFQFANELFGSNMQEYEIAIQQLNTAETLESASEYFMSIQQLYNWDSENETVKRLFELVERRYS
jgi:hypothetical protein